MDIRTAFADNCHLLEAAADRVDVTEFLRDTPGFMPSSNSITATQIYDREDGRYRPVYQNEIDLKIIRALAWTLVSKVPMGQAWVNRLIDYTIGSGFDWKISHSDKNLEKALNAIMDRCFDDNDWPSVLERETYLREIVDGECIQELVWHNGSLEISLRECDELTEPYNARELEDYYDIDFVPSWSFGVLTRKNRPQRPYRYHFVSDMSGSDWDCVDASRVCHWKRNVRTNAKRGYSDFYTPHVYLLRADKVFTNTAIGAAIQAAIAYIVENAPGTTPKQAAGLLSMTKYVGRNDGLSNPVRQGNILPGTRIETTPGSQYKAGLLGSNNSQIYIEVMESGLRMAGTVHGFPEGMLTGTYQNSNRSSSETAENPWKQGRQAEQVERGTRQKKMMTKILRIHCEAGSFSRYGYSEWSDLDVGLKVEVFPSKVFPIDPKSHAESLKIQKEQGWVSDRTASTELGRDYDAEKANDKSDGVKQPSSKIVESRLMERNPSDHVKDGDGTVFDGTPQERPATPQEKASAKKSKTKAKSVTKAAGQTFEEIMALKTPQQRALFMKAKKDGIAIPPKWTDVKYYGKEGKPGKPHIKAEGRDEAGRPQSTRDKAHTINTSNENNARIAKKLAPRMDDIRKKLAIEVKDSGSDESKVLYLMTKSGFRIGGEGDGLAKIEAIGASTLRGEHVKVDGNKVHFDFPGKKGVQQVHTIDDPIVAKIIKDAKPENGKNLFNTSDAKVRAHWKKAYSGDKPHDIRHVVATETALDAMKSHPKTVKSEKEKLSIMKEVSTIAAKKLGNNPSQALGTYIDPGIWKAIKVTS